MLFFPYGVDIIFLARPRRQYFVLESPSNFDKIDDDSTCIKALRKTLGQSMEISLSINEKSPLRQKYRTQYVAFSNISSIPLVKPDDIVDLK